MRKRNLPDNMYDDRGLLGLFIGFMASGFLGVALYRNLVMRIVITGIILGIMVILRKKFLDVLKRIKER